MHRDCSNVLTEKNLREIFTITDWSMEIDYIIHPRTGKGSNVKLKKSHQNLELNRR